MALGLPTVRALAAALDVPAGVLREESCNEASRVVTFLGAYASSASGSHEASAADSVASVSRVGSTLTLGARYATPSGTQKARRSTLHFAASRGTGIQFLAHGGFSGPMTTLYEPSSPSSISVSRLHCSSLCDVAPARNACRLD